jgi:hypothetical protein
MQGDRRPTRLLLPYATQVEALSHLASVLPPPEDEAGEISRRWQDAVNTLRAGPPRHLDPPDIEDLPDALREAGGAAAQTPQFQLLLANLNPRIGMVSLDRLIAIQKFVYVESTREDAFDKADLSSVFRYTVPAPGLRPLAVVQDQATLSYTFASDNPNLRIGGMAQSEASAPAPNGAQMPLNIHGFFVTFGGPWLQAAEFQGRWFLRDGYHRAFQLLKAGVSQVAAVLVSANSLEDLGIIRPGFIGADVLLGDRPPRLGDFHDDRWSANGSLPRVRKVVRIRAEEFVVPADD